MPEMVELRRMRPVLGTYVEVGVRAESMQTAERGMAAAFQALQLVHQLLSFHEPESDLSRLNRSAGAYDSHDAEVKLHPLSARVLRLAMLMMKVSEGRFDCTVGGALVRSGDLPEHGAGGAAPLLRGAVSDIKLEGNVARLLRPIRVTLDGIAKGYAVDYAVSRVFLCGVKSGWINAGGDMRVFGDALLPVQLRDSDGHFVPLGNLRHAAMASSRVALPQSDKDKRFPSYIMGANGAGHDASPPQSGVWTIMAKRCWRADALTKVAANLTDYERAEVIAKLGGHLVMPQTEQTIQRTQPTQIKQTAQEALKVAA